MVLVVEVDVTRIFFTNGYVGHRLASFCGPPIPVILYSVVVRGEFAAVQEGSHGRGAPEVGF
ncbi:MAG: hypothetical protein BWX50_01079 [Euryarchaeota archaeon ADurb.Bin009]|nr:MAG: hypothetical protein BWX50_01079 [Euryarchaeota archaeon ADurb.Bin009]